MKTYSGNLQCNPVKILTLFWVGVFVSTGEMILTSSMIMLENLNWIYLSLQNELNWFKHFFYPKVIVSLDSLLQKILPLRIFNSVSSFIWQQLTFTYYEM